MSCGRAQLPESAPLDQKGFFVRLEAAKEEVREAKKAADLALGKAANLKLTFDTLGRKGLAEQAKRQARAQREKIEGPAWKMFRAFLKEIEGLAVNRWYGRVESIFPGTRTEMMRPRCKIVFGRMGSQGPVAEGRLHFYCQAEKPIERFSELEELGWVRPT